MSTTTVRPAWWQEALGTSAPYGCGFGGRPSFLDEGCVLAVGFGYVTVSRDDETVWTGDDDDVTLDEFETMAAVDPDHDWRVLFRAPLSESEYQRHGSGSWVLIRKGEGFA